MENNLKDTTFLELVSRLPIRINDFYLDFVNVENLIILGEKGAFDPYTMSCRPIIKRNSKQKERIFKQLLSNPNNFIVGIYFDDEIIGRVSFNDYNSRNRSLEISYILLDEHQGKGIMTNTILEIIKILFNSTDLNKIYAHIGSFNEKSIALMKRCDFTFDGLQKQHHELNGILYDVEIYSILRKDFKRYD